MSKTLVTEWEAWRWCEATQSYERVTHSPVGQSVMQAVVAPIRLWFEDDTELDFHVWDEQSAADAARALQVHGLIECEKQTHRGFEDDTLTVLVRDWWTKQPLGKLVNTSDDLDLEV